MNKMASGAAEGVEVLRAEVERLSRELDQASSEKVQSAQYGLVLLEEKESLQQRCDDLELVYENAKHELHITQEVLPRMLRKCYVDVGGNLDTCPYHSFGLKSSGGLRCKTITKNLEMA